jgi:hypothetical protein
MNMSFVNGQAFGIAATSLTGQSLGRARPDRARRASAACQKAGALISTLMGVLMFIFRKPLVALFSSEAEILALGAGIMIFAALIQPFQSSFQIYAGALRGAGDSLFPAITLGIGILGIRPLFSSIFIQQFNMGLYGAWSALMIDQYSGFSLFSAVSPGKMGFDKSLKLALPMRAVYHHFMAKTHAAKRLWFNLAARGLTSLRQKLPTLLSGKGSLKLIPSELEVQKASNPLIVTDATLIRAGLVFRLTALLSESSIPFAIFDASCPIQASKSASTGWRCSRTMPAIRS